MPTNTQHAILAVLNLSPIIEVLVEQSQLIVTTMAGSPTFTSLSALLATTQADITALNTSQLGALNRGKGAAKARNLRAKSLLKDMGHLRNGVQLIADSTPGQEEAIILAAGMAVKRVTPRQPRVFTALPGAVSGSALLQAPRVAARKSVYWEWSVDQKTWTDAPQTLKAVTTISSLTPGTMYYFRFRALTKDGLTDWSQIVSLMMK
jgi:hypothetical protein